MANNRLKVAYLGSHLPSYYAHEHDVFGRSRRGLETLSKELDFELLSPTQPLVTAEDALRARRELEAAGADFVLLQNSTFAIGRRGHAVCGGGFSAGFVGG